MCQFSEILKDLPEDGLLRICREAWERSRHGTVVEYFSSLVKNCPACGSLCISHRQIDSYDKNGNTGWARQECYECRSTWCEVWEGVDIVELMSENGDAISFRSEDVDEDLPDLW